jgi:molybdenum cofactor guanylyltransferase
VTGRPHIAGVILAGGQGRRMDGANKALLMLGDRPFVSHVATRLRTQLDVVAINANRDLHAFLESEFHLPIAPDGIGGNHGPLDGILGAMLFAEMLGCTHALTVSVDTPFIPLNLVEKFVSTNSDEIIVAKSNGRIHGTCGLWPVALAPRLKTFILSGNSLKVLTFLNQTGFQSVNFEGVAPDPFFNINTPDDLAAAQRWL